MKYFLPLFFFGFIIACSNERGVNFTPDPLESVLTSAKKSGKMVLLDFYSDNWGGCVQLDRVVFQNETSAVFINENLISKKAYSEKDEGKELRTKYNVRGYPTVLILQPDGSELDRICGFDGNGKNFMHTLEDYLVGNNTLQTLLTQVDSDSLNIHFNYNMAMKYINRWEGEKAVKYFKRIINLDPDDKNGYREESHCYLAIYETRIKQNPSDLEAFMQKSSNDNLVRLAFNNLQRYYDRKEDQENLLRIYEFGVDKFNADASLFNSYAWYIYEKKLADKYDRGITLTRRALELQPEAAHIWDTLAWLLFVKGQKDEAIDCMKKAMALQPDRAYYRENLEKMRM